MFGTKYIRIKRLLLAVSTAVYLMVIFIANPNISAATISMAYAPQFVMLPLGLKSCETKCNAHQGVSKINSFIHTIYSHYEVCDNKNWCYHSSIWTNTTKNYHSSFFWFSDYIGGENASNLWLMNYGANLTELALKMELDTGPLTAESFKKKVLEVGTKVLWPLSNYETKHDWRKSLAITTANKVLDSPCLPCHC